MTGAAASPGRPGVSILGWSVLLFALAYLLLRYAVSPPIPSSVLGMYLVFIAVAQLIYVSCDASRFDEFTRPLVALIVDPLWLRRRRAVAVALPLLAAVYGYAAARTEIVPPAPQRSIHPAPPSQISFQGKSIDILSVESPFRHLEVEDPAAFREHVAAGKDVYYQNCVFCHGDNLEGDGIFAHGLSPIPANLADPGTIAQLQESYVFWRIAKGGPGLPAEATPWDSAMPAWEKFLSEDEIWQVTLFLYDFTGTRPRAWE